VLGVEGVELRVEGVGASSRGRPGPPTYILTPRHQNSTAQSIMPRFTKVNSPHAINLRASCGANLVTLRSKSQANETLEVNRVEALPTVGSEVCNLKGVWFNFTLFNSFTLHT